MSERKNMTAAARKAALAHFGLDDDDREPNEPKACAYCGTRPQEIGLHCVACYHDLADEEESRA